MTHQKLGNLAGFLVLLVTTALAGPTSAQDRRPVIRTVGSLEELALSDQEPHRCLGEPEEPSEDEAALAIHRIAAKEEASGGAGRVGGKDAHGEIAGVTCNAGDARLNQSIPFDLTADYVPVVGDDSQGFYCIYSAKDDGSGGTGNNVGMFLFPLSDGSILLFGSGYGDPFAPGTALFNAAYDMERVDAVVRECMGLDPASTPVRFVTPHGHGDHINPAAFRELRNLGYSIADIYLHPGDQATINSMNWSAVDRGRFRVLPNGTTCSEELQSFDSPLGKIWVYSRPGHTNGSIDLVIDIQNDPANRMVVRGSGPEGSCPPLAGQREGVQAHGNVLLNAQRPRAQGLAPARGQATGGETVTVSGTGFFVVGAGLPRVTFGGRDATNVTVLDDSTLTCDTPALFAGGSVDVGVVNRNGSSTLADSFLVEGAPSFGSFNPVSGSPQAEFTVDGSGFSILDPDTLSLRFGAREGLGLAVVSDSRITCRVPLGLPGTTVPVGLLTPSGRFDLGNFTYTALASLTDARPTRGTALGGTTLTLQGSGFLDLGSNLTVRIGTTPATNVVRLDDSTVTCQTPNGTPGTQPTITLRGTSGQATLVGGFTYNLPPRLTGITPASGPASGGTLVTLFGSGFLNFRPGVNVVSFGPNRATNVTVLDDRTLTCITPAAPAGRRMGVLLSNENGAMLLAGAFEFEDAVTVSGVSPSSGSSLGGTALSIFGAGFSSGAISATVGGTPVSGLTVVNDGTLTCVLPAGTAGALVDVTVQRDANLGTLANGFRYHARPSVASVSPTRAPAAGGTILTLSGSGFSLDAAGANQVTFGGLPASAVTVLGDASLTCVVPPGTPGVLVDVAVSNANGQGTLVGGFTYGDSLTVSSILPVSGTPRGGETVTLSGRGFVDVAAPTVTFDGQAATAVQVLNDTTLTCLTPAGLSASLADVIVTNSNGVATLTGGFRFHRSPVVNLISPTSGSAAGGTSIIVFGSGFRNDFALPNQVFIDGNPSSTVTVFDDTALLCAVPPGTPGLLADVRLSNRNGESTLVGAFQYDIPAPTILTVAPASGPAAGGTTVTLTGVSFDDGTGAPAVTFGGVPAGNVVLIDGSTLTCTSPVGSAGTSVSIVVTNDRGVGTRLNGFRYHARPTLSSLTPGSASSLGGRTVTLTGTGFQVDSAGTNVVQVGGQPTSGLAVTSDGALTFQVPPGTAGTTVDVTLANANGSAILMGALRYHARPSLVSLSPNRGPSTGGQTVLVGGSGFVADAAGANQVTFGGAPAQAVNVIDNTTLSLKVPAGTAGQRVDVTLTNANGTSVLTEGYLYNAKPTVTAVSPASAPFDAAPSIALSGSGFTAPGAGTHQVTFGALTASNVQVVNDTTLTCRLPAGTPASVLDVRVTNGNGAGVLLGGFRFHARPVASSLSPSSSRASGGQLATLSGSGFQVDGAGPNTVLIAGQPAGSVTLLDDTSLTFMLPPGSAGTTVDLELRNANGSSLLLGALRYHERPTLVGSNPAMGSPGTVVTLSGSGFAADQPGANMVLFGGVPATGVTVLGDASLTCEVPSGSVGSTVDIALSNANGQAELVGAFTYDQPLGLTSISPDHGSSLGGTAVSIVGSRFDEGPLTVTIGGAAVSNLVVVSPTELTCTVPAGLGGDLATVSVASSSGTALLVDGFRYHARPLVTGAVPETGPATGGTSVLLFGFGFQVDQAGANTVTVGGIPVASASLFSDTAVLVITPAGPAGSLVDIELHNANGTTVLVDGFYYAPEAPRLSSVSPAVGSPLGGTAVTLTGRGFSDFSAGANTVTFGAFPATGIVVVSDTSLTCLAPSGSPGNTVDVSLSNNNGSALLAGGFTYAEAPVVTTVTPNSVSSLGGEVITLAGSGFAAAPAATVTFDGVPSPNVVIVNDTTLSVEVPSGPAGASVDLQVRNANGQDLRVNGLRYHALPTLGAVLPGSGSSLGGASLLVTGSGFQNDRPGTNLFTIGGLPAANVTVLDDVTLTLDLPAGPAGTVVDVALSNANGAAQRAGAFRYHDLPTVASLTPASGTALGGTSVLIGGSGFVVDAAGQPTVTFGGVPALNASVVGNTMIACEVPPGTPAARVDVAVRNANGTGTLLEGFQYVAPVPTLALLVPDHASALGGATVVLSGSGFQDNLPGTNQVLIGGVAATAVNVIDDATLEVIVPAGTPGSTVDVALSNNNGSAQLLAGFRYHDSPTLAATAPASATSLGGNLLLLTGDGFVRDGAGANAVAIGGVPATGVNVMSDGTLTCQVPAGVPGAVLDVTLSNKNGVATLVGGFRYHDRPLLSGVTPANGLSTGGTTVLLSGAGFQVDLAGTNSVTFGGISATAVTVLNDATLSCVTPGGAPGSQVDVRVSNGNGAAVLAAGFQYEAPAPTLASVTPAQGSAQGGGTVTLTGTGFQANAAGLNTVRFGGTTALSVSVLGDGTLTCLAPAGTPGSVVDVTVSNANGVASLLGAYEYFDAPTVASLAPASTSSLGGAMLLVQGSGFLANGAGATSVTIGGQAAGSINVLADDALSCIAPAGTAGALVDLQVSNANGTALLVGGFRYHDQPVLSSATPPSSPAAGGISVLLSGAGFQVDAAGANSVSFGGLPATNLMVVGDGALSCQVPAGTPGSVVDISLTNANGSSVLVGGFRYHTAPTLASISPPSGSSLGGTLMTLTGSGFLSDVTGTTGVLFAAVNATEVTIVSDTTATCVIPPGTPGATVAVRIGNGNGVGALLGAFRYHALPTLASLAPDNGDVLGGDLVTLTGSGFQVDGAGAATVTFDGIPATLVTVLDDQTLTCVTPAGQPGALAQVRVRNANGSTLATLPFGYSTPPTIGALSPISMSSLGGIPVNITGTGFLAERAGGATVTFGGTPASNVFIVNDTTLTCTAPAGPPGTAVDVRLTNGNGSVILSRGLRYHALPAVTSSSPGNGSSSGGTSVLIFGSGFVADFAGANTVRFGANLATMVMPFSDNALLCSAPGGTPGETVEISVQNANGVSLARSAYTYDIPAPILLGVDPNSGSPLGGTLVTLSGSGFQAFSPGTNLVRFGGAQAQSVSVVNDTTLTCVAPPGAPGFSVNVSLQNQNGSATLIGGFTYEVGPSLASIAPAAGRATGGTLVTLSGSNLASGTTPTVTIGGQAASGVTVVNASTISCIAPGGTPGSVADVVLANQNGTATLSGAFTFNAPPTLAAIAPALGSAAGGLTVTLTGTGFQANQAGNNRVTFDGLDATNVVVLGDTSLTCQTPQGLGGSQATVVVSNDNGDATLANAFTFHPTPAIASVSPNVGPPSGGVTVLVFGSGFVNLAAGTNSIEFGGVPATGVTVFGDTALLCVTPAGTLGQTVDVTVTNANGSGQLLGGFTYQAPRPVLAGLLPNSGSPVGGTTVTLAGENFADPAAGVSTVHFGAVQGTNLVVVDDSTIEVDAPAGNEGTFVSVTVGNDTGTDTLVNAFRYHLRPTLASLSPADGPAQGGTAVLLTGTGFLNDGPGMTSVTFDGQPAANVVVLTDTSLSCETPAGISGGMVTVAIQNDNGTGQRLNAFRYRSEPLLTSLSPASGTSLGGTTVSLSGSGFANDGAGTNLVTLGGVAVLNLNVIDDGSLEFEVPTGTAGSLVDLEITNQNGTALLVDGFRYHALPTLVSTSPTSLAASGGTTVLLTGTGFQDDAAGANSLTVGGLPATNMVVLDDTTLQFDAPPGLPGTLAELALANDNGAANLPAGLRYHALPTLTTLNPEHGPASGATLVTLSGTGFLADAAGTNTVLIDGRPASAVTVLDDATLTCAVPPGSAGSSVDVELRNANGTTLLATSFRYHALPTLASVLPGSSTSLGGTALLISGSGFLLDQAGVNSLTLGGVPALSVQVVNDTTLTAVAPAGTPGLVGDVELQNANGAAALTAGFRFHERPNLATITPTKGSPMGGTTVLVTGRGFSADQPGTNSVTFGGVPATSVIVIDDGTLSCVVPAGTAGTSVDLALGNDNGLSTLVSAFRYNGAPSISLVSPASGTSLGGSTVTVTGAGFLEDGAGTTSVQLGGQAGLSVTVVSDTELTFTAPAGTAGSVVDLQLSNQNGAASRLSAFRYHDLPTLAGVSPANGPESGGSVLTFTGSGFLADAPGTNSVLLGGQPATAVTVLDDSTLTAAAPAGAAGATVDVVLSNQNGATTLLGAFTYNDAPQIGTLSINHGSSLGGTAVTVTGQGFQASGAGVTTVLLGGQPVSGLAIASNTSLSFQAPAGAAGSLADLSLANANGSALRVGAFRYHALPTLTSVAPSTGLSTGGTSVILFGTGFQNDSAGVNQVLFNGVPAQNISPFGDAALLCDTPPGAAGLNADVTLRNANGEVLLVGGFLYQAAPPVLASVSPSSGPAAGGSTVTLQGSGFLLDGAGTNTVTFGGLLGQGVTVLDDATLTVQVPAGSAGSTVDVRVTNANGQSTRVGGWRYHALPTLANLAPASGSLLGGELLTLTGSGFLSDAPGPNTLTLGGVPVANLAVLDDATLTFEAPAGSGGATVDLALQNANGSTQLFGAFRYHAAPTVASVTPASGSALGGDALLVVGSGFQVDAAGTPALSFGGSPATNVLVIDDTTISCEVPAGAAGTTVNLELSNANGTSVLLSAFRYHGPPMLAAVVPDRGSALGGTTVLVTGSGFLLDNAGANNVTFGGAPGTNLLVIDDTTLAVDSPAGTAGVSVDLVLTNQNGSATLPGGFAYNLATSLTLVSPVSGPAQGGTALTLIGTGFLDGAPSSVSVTIAGQPAFDVTVVDDSTITCTTPAGTAATVANVRVTTLNGQGTLPAGFRFHSLPSITAVTPASGSSLNPLPALVVGSGFLNDAPGTLALAIGGQAATGISVIDDATLSCVIPAGTAGTQVAVALTTDNGAATLPNGFRYHALPALLTLNPTSATSLGGQPVLVTGSGFTVDNAGATTVTLGGLPVANLVVLDDATLTFETPVGTDGTIVDLAVSNANGQVTLGGAFRFHAAPAVTGVSPSSGSPLGGTPILITGAGFLNDLAGTPTVLIDGLPAQNVLVIDDSAIACETPAGPPSASVTVEVSNANGLGLRSNAFAFFGPPTLTSVGPVSGTSAGGTQVDLHGGGFLTNGAGTNTVTFGGQAALSVTVLDDATLRCTTPAGLPATAVDVAVSNANGSTQLPGAFQYHALPTLTAVSPASGPFQGGETLTLTGTAFLDNAPAGLLVTLGGQAAADIVVVDDTTVTCTVPAGAAGTTADVQLTNLNGAAQLLAAFRYHAEPTLAGISPVSGSSLTDTNVTLTGSGFLIDAAGAPTITVGGQAVANPLVVDDTTLTFDVPAGTAGSLADVTLTNANGSDLLTAAFRFHELPTIGAPSPDHGTSLGGTTVTLTGTGFLSDAAGTNVLLVGGQPATGVTVLDDTTLTFVAPAGTAGTLGDLSLSNDNGMTVLGTGFRYHALPTISGLSPDSGVVEGGATVTLFGTGFLDDQAGANLVTVGGLPVANLVVLDDATLRFDSPVGTGGSLADVQVSNANGSVIAPGAFRFHAAPTITGFSPANGPAAGGTAVMISGTGFQVDGAGTPTLLLDGQPASNVIVIDDANATFETPTGLQGATVNLELSNANGTAFVLAGFRYHALPTLTGVSPASGTAAGGELVTLTGSGFQVDAAGTNLVTVGGLPALNVTPVDDATLTFEVPAGAAGVLADIALSNDNGATTLPGAFRYHDLPSIAGLTPASAPRTGGLTVTLNGTGFLNDNPGANLVTVGGAAGTNVLVLDDTTLVFEVPAGLAGAVVDVEVSNANGTMLLAAGFRYHELPVVGGLTPTGGPSIGGTVVTLTGTGFQVDGAGTNLVTFAGTPATNVTVLDDATLTCEAPAGVIDALVDIEVTNTNGNAMLASSFRYFRLIELSSLSPAGGYLQGGTFVTLTGAGFLSQPLGAGALTFGGLPALNVTVVDDTTLTCQTPAGAGGSMVDVAIDNGASVATLTTAFRYYAAPTVGSFSPTAGSSLGGNTVMVSGSGFLDDEAGTTSVTFGGLAATNVTVLDDGTIACEAPAGLPTATVAVAVQNQRGSANLPGYGYHPTPSITLVDPFTLDPDGGVPVNVMGTGFLANGAGTNLVTFGGTPATGIVVLDDTTLSCVAPQGPLRTNGDVIVTNGNGTGFMSNAVRWQRSFSSDLNDDGIQDIVIGAPGTSVGSSLDGSVYVFFGSDQGMIDTSAANADLVIEASILQAELGWRLAAGDVSGDGFPDLLISAHKDDLGGLDSGSVFVFHGPLAPSITPLTTADADLTLFGEQAGDYFGSSMAIGDVNDDQIKDVIVGAKLHDAGALDSGAGYVFFGGTGLASGSATGASLKFSGTEVRSEFGSITLSGDYNGDGIDDLLFSAPKSQLSGANAGAIHLFHGSATLASAPSGAANVTLTGESATDRFGSAMTTGDVNGDGLGDLVVGAPLSGRVGTLGGAVFVFFDHASLVSANAATADVILDMDVLGGRLGSSLDTGDVNGDGVLDLLVGAPYADDPLRLSGKAYLFLGGAGFVSQGAINAAAVFTAEAVAGERFGTDVAIEDIDGDGLGDMIISAHLSDGGGSDSGRVYVFRGSATPGDLGALNDDLTLTGTTAGDTFGAALINGK